MHITKKTYMLLKEYPSLKNQKILVSYSAGADSTALLHILNKNKKNFNFEIDAVFFKHVNSPISDGEDKSLDCASEFCKNLGVNLIVCEIDMKKTTKESWEELGRKGRLKFFKESNYESIFLGHHEDDQNETTMMQLFRGGGRGIAGMKVKEGKIYRPFLNLRKEEIYHYLKEENLNWVEDPTNVNTDFTRNFWRKSALPLISQHYQGYAQSLKNFREKQKINNNLLLDLAYIDGLQKLVNGESLDVSNLTEERKINLIQNLGTKLQSYIEINNIKNILKQLNNSKTNNLMLSTTKYDLVFNGNSENLTVNCIKKNNIQTMKNKII